MFQKLTCLLCNRFQQSFQWWQWITKALTAVEPGVPSTNPPSHCCCSSHWNGAGALFWGGSALAMPWLGESMPGTGITAANSLICIRVLGWIPASQPSAWRNCSSQHHNFIVLSNLTSPAFYKYLSQINPRANTFSLFNFFKFSLEIGI